MGDISGPASAPLPAGLYKFDPFLVMLAARLSSPGTVLSRGSICVSVPGKSGNLPLRMVTSMTFRVLPIRPKLSSVSTSSLSVVAPIPSALSFRSHT